MSDIVLRRLEKASDLDAVVELQKVYWGEDSSGLVPAHMLMGFAKYGGLVVGAYDAEQLVGALIAFLGTTAPVESDRQAADELMMISKRTVVLPAYRGAKIGERLKRMQYEVAKKQGIRLIRWTFDPLLAKNAYFNLFKLGAIIRHYEEDFFGAAANHPRLQADRMVADWLTGHPHAEAHLNHQIQAPSLSALRSDNACVIEGKPATDALYPPESLPAPAGDSILIEIPYDVTSLDDALIVDWRNTVRQAFQSCLVAGYIATGFVREGRRGFYLLIPDSGEYGFPSH